MLVVTNIEKTKQKCLTKHTLTMFNETGCMCFDFKFWFNMLPKIFNLSASEHLCVVTIMHGHCRA